MKSFLIYIAITNWLLGMVLTILSNATLIIKPNEIKKTSWRKYRRGYTIKEIKTYINNCDDQTQIGKLKRKIIYRRLFPLFFLSTLIIIYIANSI